jgi:hypothetical protein
MRVCLVFALLTVAAGDPFRLVPTPGAPDPRPPEAPAGKMLVTDPTYTPGAGDRAILFSYDRDVPRVWICKDLFAFEDYIRSMEAKDSVGLEGLARAGRAAVVTDGTAVLVLEYRDNPYIGKGHPSCEVRLEDGPYANQKAWCLASEVVRVVVVPKPRALIEAERKAARKGAEADRKADPAKQAAALLDIADALRDSGKVEAAGVYYRRIARDFPGTPAAKQAASRLAPP